MLQVFELITIVSYVKHSSINYARIHVYKNKNNIKTFHKSIHFLRYSKGLRTFEMSFLEIACCHRDNIYFKK